MSVTKLEIWHLFSLAKKPLIWVLGLIQKYLAVSSYCRLFCYKRLFSVIKIQHMHQFTEAQLCWSNKQHPSCSMSLIPTISALLTLSWGHCLHMETLWSLQLWEKRTRQTVWHLFKLPPSAAIIPSTHNSSAGKMALTSLTSMRWRRIILP